MTAGLVVRAGAGRLAGPGVDVAARLGRAGALPAGAKREGDGATPLGALPVRCLLLRPGRVTLAARPGLPWRWLAPDDGWSDDPRDPAYNQPVCHPHPFSAERLWRDDGLYDRIVVLGWNDAPPVAGRGSAIFLHALPDGDRATEGCIAVDRTTLDALMVLLAPGDLLEVLP